MLDISLKPEKEQWDNYASGHPAAKYAHLFDWGKELAAIYSQPLYTLAAIDTGTNQIRGILPLILFAPPGQTVRLISLPYTDAAGIVADDPESSSILLGAALKLADQLGANHLELRQDGTLHSFFNKFDSPDNWTYTPHNFKTGLSRPLPASTESLWSQLSAKVRNQVRKAKRCECNSKTGNIELLSDFYKVFSENMRDLGSPVHAFELFQNLLEAEALPASILVIYISDKPVAGAFVLRHNRTLFNPWASSLRRYRPSCPNMLLYWSMLKYAVKHDCSRFDFGRSSPDAPTCRFKLQWGAEMDELSWHVFQKILRLEPSQRVP